MNTPDFSFSTYHRKLDNSTVGFTAHDSKRHLVSFDSRTLVCESREPMSRWLVCQFPANKAASFCISRIVYASIVRYSHEEGIGYFMDKGSSIRLKAIQQQDLRFSPVLKPYRSCLGTLLELEYDPFRDSVALLQAQVDRFIVGYCTLGSDNEPHIDCTPAKTLPLTWKSFRCHLAEGYRFKGDDVVRGRLRDLRNWQGYCQMVAAEERNEETL